MKQVIVYPRGQLSAKDKEKLSKNGFVAVEADDPKSVVVIVPGAPLLTGDDMLMAAMAGVTGSNIYNRSDLMVTELHRRMKAREAERAAMSREAQ